MVYVTRSLSRKAKITAAGDSITSVVQSIRDQSVDSECHGIRKSKRNVKRIFWIDQTTTKRQFGRPSKRNRASKPLATVHEYDRGEQREENTVGEEVVRDEEEVRDSDNEEVVRDVEGVADSDNEEIVRDKERERDADNEKTVRDKERIREDRKPLPRVVPADFAAKLPLPAFIEATFSSNMTFEDVLFGRDTQFIYSDNPPFYVNVTVLSQQALRFRNMLPGTPITVPAEKSTSIFVVYSVLSHLHGLSHISLNKKNVSSVTRLAVQWEAPTLLIDCIKCLPEMVPYIHTDQLFTLYLSMAKLRRYADVRPIYEAVVKRLVKTTIDKEQIEDACSELGDMALELITASTEANRKNALAVVKIEVDNDDDIYISTPRDKN